MTLLSNRIAAILPDDSEPVNPGDFAKRFIVDMVRICIPDHKVLIEPNSNPQDESKAG
jgi:hypothetical protein